MTDKKQIGRVPGTGSKDTHTDIDIDDLVDDLSHGAGGGAQDEPAISESPEFDGKTDNPFEVTTYIEDSATTGADILGAAASGSASHDASEDPSQPKDDVPTRVVDLRQLASTEAAAKISTDVVNAQTVVDYRPKSPGPSPDGAASEPSRDEWDAVEANLDFTGIEAVGPSPMAVGDVTESAPAHLDPGDASGMQAATAAPRAMAEKHPYTTPVVLICAAAMIVIILGVMVLWPTVQQAAHAPAPPLQEGTGEAMSKREAAVVVPSAARPATEQSSAVPAPSRAAAEPKSVQRPAATVGKYVEPAPRPREIERSPPQVTRTPKATAADRPPPSRERRRKPRRVKDDSRAGKRPAIKGSLDSLFDKFESSP